MLESDLGTAIITVLITTVINRAMTIYETLLIFLMQSLQLKVHFMTLFFFCRGGKKLRFREGKSVIQHHTGSNEQNQDFGIGLS